MKTTGVVVIRILSCYLSIPFQKKMPEQNLEKALEIKLQGNECYKKSEFQSAVDLYSQAIQTCPATKTSDLAIMYQNRAVAYERLEKLEEALKDCGESLR